MGKLSLGILVFTAILGLSGITKPVSLVKFDKQVIDNISSDVNPYEHYKVLAELKNLREKSFLKIEKDIHVEASEISGNPFPDIKIEAEEVEEPGEEVSLGDSTLTNKQDENPFNDNPDFGIPILVKNDISI